LLDPGVLQGQDNRGGAANKTKLGVFVVGGSLIDEAQGEAHDGLIDRQRPCDAVLIGWWV